MDNMTPVAGFEGLYSITEEGQIYGHSRRGWLKAFVREDGYHQVILSKHNVSYTFRVHELMLLTFRGPKPNDEYESSHEDDNKDNNTLGNLIWRHRIDNNRRRSTVNFARGEQHGRAKLTEQQVREIRKRGDAGESSRRLGAEFAVSQVMANNIIRRKAWRHVP